MKKMLFAGTILWLAAIAAYGQMGLEYGECPPLMMIESMLELSDQQRMETQNLSQEYAKELNEQVQKVKEELNAKYTEIARDSLTDEQKKQFDGLLAAEETVKKAIRTADADYRAMLIDLFARDDTPEHAVRRLKETPMLPQDKKQIIESMAQADRSLQQKLTPLRTANSTKLSKVMSTASTVDWRNPAESRKWREETKQQREQLEAEYLEAGIQLLSEEQKAVFEQALEALEIWQTTRGDAESDYMKNAGEALGEAADPRRLEMRAQQLMREQMMMMR